MENEDKSCRCTCGNGTPGDTPQAPPLKKETILVMGIGGCAPRPIYSGECRNCCCHGGDGENGLLRMVIDTGGYTDIAPGETVHCKCYIYKGQSEDVTGSFTVWTLTRDTGDNAADTVWNVEQARINNGEFAITWDDLGAGITIFTVNAYTRGSSEPGATCRMVF